MYTNNNEIDNVKRIFIKDVSNQNNITDELTKIETVNEKDEKKIVITELTNGSKQIKKKEKEKKMRVETKTWGLNNDDLSFETQLHLLKIIFNKEITSEKIINKHIAMIVSHIKAKISSYKQQDILKNKLNDSDFVSLNDVIELLFESQMKCHYCSCETYLLYEVVRENKQWSLDRINNEIGHNRNNLLIACLECNLKRRRRSDEKFLFTKQMKLVKID